MNKIRTILILAAVVFVIFCGIRFGQFVDSLSAKSHDCIGAP